MRTHNVKQHHKHLQEGRLQQRMHKGIIILAIVPMLLFSATFTVNNTGDTNTPGTLRWAINQANATPGWDMIDFNIGGGGVQTIYPQSQLPPLVDTAGVTIDGLTQPGASAGSSPPSSCVLMIELNGAFAGASHGLWVLSPHNFIQGLVVDSFEQHGIRIQGTPGGTYNNVVVCCFVGTDPSGTIIRMNGWNGTRFWGGIYIEVAPDTLGFAFDNHIDNNLSSGNYAEGIGISSCPPGDVSANFVIGNYIGTDISGTVDLGNIHDGVYIGEGAHDNMLDTNLIAGNDFEGVCIVGYWPSGWNSYRNIVFHNVIGLDINLVPLMNTMDGVSIGQYGNLYQGGFASGNIVDTNIIACNGANGVTVWEHQITPTNCDSNLITRNSFYTNGGLGIDLNDDGVTLNDATDPDTGPNEEVNFPDNLLARYFVASGQTIVDGTIDIDTDPTQAVVEVFRAQVDPSGYGEGRYYLGMATPDATGYWSLITTSLNLNDVVTATTTDMNLNTSEFCQNATVVLGIEENNGLHHPVSYRLTQNSPNPFVEVTAIEFSIPKCAHVIVEIFDVSGQCVKTLVDHTYEPSHNVVYWNGTDENAQPVACGIYFYRLQTDDYSETRKMVFSR
jgi:hypothetical protein